MRTYICYVSLVKYKLRALLLLNGHRLNLIAMLYLKWKQSELLPNLAPSSFAPNLPQGPVCLALVAFSLRANWFRRPSLPPREQRSRKQIMGIRRPLLNHWTSTGARMWQQVPRQKSVVLGCSVLLTCSSLAAQLPRGVRSLVSLYSLPRANVAEIRTLSLALKNPKFSVNDEVHCKIWGRSL